MIGLGSVLVVSDVQSPLLNLDFTTFPNGTMSDADFLAATGITHTGTTPVTFSSGLVIANGSDDLFTVPNLKLVDGGRVSIETWWQAAVDRSSSTGNALWTTASGVNNALVNRTFGGTSAAVAGDDEGIDFANWDAGDLVQLFIAAGGGLAARSKNVSSHGAFAGTGPVQGNYPAGLTWGLWKTSGSSGALAGLAGTIKSIKAWPKGQEPL